MELCICIGKDTQPVSLSLKESCRKFSQDPQGGKHIHTLHVFSSFINFPPFLINLHIYIWQRCQRDNDSAPWLPYTHHQASQASDQMTTHHRTREGSSGHQPLLLRSAPSCPTLCDPMDCTPPGSSAHRILQARTLEWVVVSFSRGISPTQGSYLGFWRLGLTKVW